MTEPVWLLSSLYPDHYEVSDHGQVRSRVRSVPTIDPQGRPTTRTRGGKILAIQYGGRNKRYARVQLRPGDARKVDKVWVALHALVCETFHGPRPEGMLCCHRDDDQNNNRADNLYWGTRAENEEDRARNSGSYADAGADVELAGCDW